MRETTWAKLQVGDIVKIRDDDFFPSDIIPIASGIKGGACYIETGSLDGEKNLKKKQCPIETCKLYHQGKTPTRAEITVKAPPPDPFIYEFKNASMKIEHYQENKRRLINLTSKNFLPRGAKLKNSSFIIGIVVYTGRDTKIMQNSEQSRYKLSNVENVVNQLILTILAI